jgi:hypothetical protein
MADKTAKPDVPAREDAGAPPKKKQYAVLTKEESFKLGHPGWSTRGYIPHFSADGKMQHVIFRLADALPAGVLERWEEDLRVLPEGEAKRQNTSWSNGIWMRVTGIVICGIRSVRRLSRMRCSISPESDMTCIPGV